MKGIKECINWMLDNPMKELEAMGLKNWRWNNKEECFERKTDLGYWMLVSYLDDLNVAEWEEVKTPYSIEEAIEEVKKMKL